MFCMGSQKLNKEHTAWWTVVKGYGGKRVRSDGGQSWDKGAARWNGAMQQFQWDSEGRITEKVTLSNDLKELEM